MAECSAALEGQPSFFKALVRRAKAYEQLGQHKAALADLQRANRLDAATDDTRDSERRLREAVAGKKPAGMGGGLAQRGKASAVPTKAPAGGRQIVFPAKLSMGDDTRFLQVRATPALCAGASGKRACKDAAAAEPLARRPRGRQPGTSALVLPPRLQLVPGVTYFELTEHVRQLYPAAGPFVLKFVDK